MTAAPGPALRATPLATLLAVALAGCAPSAALVTNPPTVKPPAGRSGEVTGGVAFASGGLGGSVAYGPWELRGAGLDLTYAGDGTWTGTWNGAPARFVATQGLVRGPDTAVTVTLRDGGLALAGTWAGRPVALQASRGAVRGTLGTEGCGVELVASEPGLLAGPVGCPATSARPASGSPASLRLQGEAILVPDVLVPQFVLALLAVLP